MAGDASGDASGDAVIGPRSVTAQCHDLGLEAALHGVLQALSERFGIECVVLVGDRAMITQAHAEKLKELGAVRPRGSGAI